MLSDRERKVVQSMLDAWDAADAPLPGHLCYQDVFDLCDKFGVPHPPRLTRFIAWAEAQKDQACPIPPNPQDESTR